MRRLALLLGLLAAAPALAEEASEAPSVLVTLVPAQRGTLDVRLVAYGEIAPAPGAALTIGIEHAGEVVRLPVAAGQLVRKGDTLFDFSADPTVVLAYRQAAATLTLARREEAHLTTLLAQKLATRAQLDEADKAVLDAEAGLDAQKRLGGDRSTETAAAPFTGIVATLAAAAGEHVQANAAILQLVPKDRLVARFGIEPEDWALLAPGMKVELTATARSSKPAGGAVLAVGGAVDPKTQMIEVTASVPTDGNLLLGEHVAVAISTATVSGWIVPRAAILVDKDGPYLFQTAAGKAKRIGVSIVGEAGDSTAVEGPVDPASPIVAAGNYQLSDGMAVREASSPAPAADQAK